MGGARSAVFQTSCRPIAISATRNTGQRWLVSGASRCLAKTGKPAVDLFRALKSGEIKAVWIACTNPAQSMPDVAEVRAALETAEFVVLQEAYGNTDTAQYADLLLPATSWGEKEGTVTNSERRISRVRAAVPPPGEARHDWQIALDFARRLGLALHGEAQGVRSPKALSPRRRKAFTPNIVPRRVAVILTSPGSATRCSKAQDRSSGRIPKVWPKGRVRLYADGVFPTPSGRARFVAVDHKPTAELTDPARPISLLTGRLLEQWHGMSRTGTVPRLFNGEDEPILKMHACDLRHRGLEPGELAKISNGRGEIVVRVDSDGSMPRGRAWLPMHWGEQFMNGYGANALMPSATDPYSFQPELEHTAVAVEKAELPWSLAVVRVCGEGLMFWRFSRRPARCSSAFPVRRSACVEVSNRWSFFVLLPLQRRQPNCSPKSMRSSRWPVTKAPSSMSIPSAASTSGPSPATAGCAACAWLAKRWRWPG